MTDRGPWTVTLLCGASGVGKSRLAQPLAARYRVPLIEADDIVTALQAMTTADQLPWLHWWKTHPEAALGAPAQVADLHFQIAGTLRPAFSAVIADHVEFGAPAVIEGDYLLPELAAEFGSAVRAVVVSEREEDRIMANYQLREPGPEQRHRAQVSVLVSSELTQRADRCQVPVVPARPWETGLDRLDHALGASGLPTARPGGVPG